MPARPPRDANWGGSGGGGGVVGSCAAPEKAEMLSAPLFFRDRLRPPNPALLPLGPHGRRSGEVEKRLGGSGWAGEAGKAARRPMEGLPSILLPSEATAARLPLGFRRRFTASRPAQPPPLAIPRWGAGDGAHSGVGRAIASPRARVGREASGPGRERVCWRPLSVPSPPPRRALPPRPASHPLAPSDSACAPLALDTHAIFTSSLPSSRPPSVPAPPGLPPSRCPRLLRSPAPPQPAARPPWPAPAAAGVGAEAPPCSGPSRASR